MGISSLRSPKTTSRCTKTNTHKLVLVKTHVSIVWKKRKNFRRKEGRTWGEKISNWKWKERNSRCLGCCCCWLLTCWLLLVEQSIEPTWKCKEISSWHPMKQVHYVDLAVLGVHHTMPSLLTNKNHHHHPFPQETHQHPFPSINHEEMQHFISTSKSNDKETLPKFLTQFLFSLLSRRKHVILS